MLQVPRVNCNPLSKHLEVLKSPRTSHSLSVSPQAPSLPFLLHKAPRPYTPTAYSKTIPEVYTRPPYRSRACGIVPRRTAVSYQSFDAPRPSSFPATTITTEFTCTFTTRHRHFDNQRLFLKTIIVSERVDEELRRIQGR